MSQELNEESIQKIVSRLEPFVQASDIEGFKSVVRELISDSGKIKEVASAAARLSKIYPALNGQILSSMSEHQRSEFNAQILDIIVYALEASNLRVEEHFRTVGEFAFLTHTAIAALKEYGLNSAEMDSWGVDSLDDYGFDRIGGFVHPFSRLRNSKDRTLPDINFWTVVSGVVSIAQGWFEPSGEGGKEGCFDKLKRWIMVAAPELDIDDIEVLMRRSRYSDESLIVLCKLAHTGLAKTIEEKSKKGENN